MMNRLQAVEMVLFYSLVIDGYLKMSDVNVGNGSMNIQIISQKDLNFNIGGMSCGNGSINSHYIYQWNYQSSFKDMDGYA